MRSRGEPAASGDGRSAASARGRGARAADDRRATGAGAGAFAASSGAAAGSERADAAAAGVGRGARARGRFATGSFGVTSATMGVVGGEVASGVTAAGSAFSIAVVVFAAFDATFGTAGVTGADFGFAVFRLLVLFLS